MEFLIDPYIKNNVEDLSFVHLKGNAQLNIKNYLIPSGGLDVPMLTEEMANNIKTKKENEVITVAGIIRGMAYTLGIDQNFKFKEDYLRFLRAVDENIEEYILFQGMNSADKNKILESLIYSKAVLVINEANPKALLSYGVTLLKYAEEDSSNKRRAKVFKREAMDKLEQLLTIQEEPMAYYQLAYLYKEARQFKKAQFYAEKLLDFEVDDLLQVRVKHLLYELTDLVQYEIGYEAILAGKIQEGLPILLELEEKYPEWWNLIFFVGLGYRQLGEYNEAILRFQTVINLKEDMLDAMVELALCYSSLGNYIEASDYFHRALELGGDDAEILCNLSIVYMEMGNYEEASTYLERSLELNDKDEISLACKKRLEELMK